MMMMMMMMIIITIIIIIILLYTVQTKITFRFKLDHLFPPLLYRVGKNKKRESRAARSSSS